MLLVSLSACPVSTNTPAPIVPPMPIINIWVRPNVRIKCFFSILTLLYYQPLMLRVTRRMVEMLLGS